jgi:hypothetical protein
MNDFIFRFPENTPELTYETLGGLTSAACGKFFRCTSCRLHIGTTVSVRWNARGDALIVRLYDLDIAWLYADRVAFTHEDDPHMATTEWLARIVRDNGIGNTAGRIRRRKADGLGPWTSRGRAGLLVISWSRDMPVIGCTYPVNRERIEANRANAAHWAEMLEHDRANA